MKYYTLDEVANITGINKRTLKYYVERKIIIPSSERNEGQKKYWLYSDSDISKIKQIALYNSLFGIVCPLSIKNKEVTTNEKILNTNLQNTHIKVPQIL